MIQFKKVRNDYLNFNIEVDRLIEQVKSGRDEFKDVRYATKPAVLEKFIYKDNKIYMVSVQVHETSGISEADYKVV